MFQTQVCVKMRVNPRRVRKPVIKTWCTDGKGEEEEDKEDEEETRARRRGARVRKQKETIELKLEQKRDNVFLSPQAPKLFREW